MSDLSSIEWFRSNDGERLTGLDRVTGKRLFWICPRAQGGFDLQAYLHGYVHTICAHDERECVEMAEEVVA